MISPDVVIKRLAPIEIDDQGEQLISSLIEQATATIGRHLNRYLGQPKAQVEVRQLGLGVDCFYLREDPDPGFDLVVRTRSNPATAWGSADVVPTTDYGVDGRRLEHTSAWPAALQISYGAGYRVDAGPAELRALVEECVLQTLRRGMVSNAALGAGTDEFKRETMGDYTYERFDASNTDLQMVDPTSLIGWARVATNWRRPQI